MGSKAGAVERILLNCILKKKKNNNNNNNNNKVLL